MLDMLSKQASQVKTAADQFRDLMHNLDKLAFKPDPVRKMEGMDPLLAVREYDSPVYMRHRTSPGGVDELLSEPPKRTVAETNRLTSEAQEPPQPSEDGSDNRQIAKDNKSLGAMGYTWEQNRKPEIVPNLAVMKVPGTGGTATPQPSIPKSASRRSRIQGMIAKLAEQKKIGFSEGYRKPTAHEEWWLPEGIIGAAIPLDPAKREEAYRHQTRMNAPANAIAGGLFGGLAGHAIHESPIGAALGAGAGSLILGGGSILLRNHMANKIRDRAILEEIERNRNLPE